MRNPFRTQAKAEEVPPGKEWPPLVPPPPPPPLEVAWKPFEDAGPVKDSDIDGMLDMMRNHKTYPGEYGACPACTVDSLRSRSHWVDRETGRGLAYYARELANHRAALIRAMQVLGANMVDHEDALVGSATVHEDREFRDDIRYIHGRVPLMKRYTYNAYERRRKRLNLDG